MNCIGPRALALSATILIAAALTACTARIDTQGYIPDEDLIAQVQIGVAGPAEVAELLGTPPSSRIFSVDESMTWYYIMRRTKTESFFDEEVLEQRVLAVEFDESGVVKGFRNYTLADGRQIEPVDRVTATRGKKLGLLEQMFGNLGRFGSQDAGVGP
jgi:outer membrane protein assembly factor BamE (lipoprotein component of BamABCDE complex)